MSITTSNLSNKDRLERIWHLLQDAEKLQQERINSGFDYVNLYVEDVESDWLENWGEDFPELPVRLRQWFHDVFEPDWHSIEDIFVTAGTSVETKIALQTAGVKRAKLIDLESPVALIVTLKNESSTTTSILLQVHGTDLHYLPENLLMTVLSPLGDVRGCARLHPQRSAIAHGSSEVIQLEFTVERGEEFTVELTSGNVTMTQNFLM
jgi:Protein of unknown function (DUF1822)